MVMKIYRYVIAGFFCLIMLSLASCNPEGDCTIVCECMFSGFQSTSSIELGGGYTKDECKEGANFDDVVGCDCNGEWSRSRN
jgi:hypothetical protein